MEFEERFQSQQPELLKVTSKEHKQKLIDSHSLVVFDIYGDWCGPCKECEPKVRELAVKYNSPNILICKECVDDKITPNIEGVPVFHFYKNRVFVHTVIGADMASVEKAILHLKQ
jgi:thiol-disulfide isomerase/thioredoxin